MAEAIDPAEDALEGCASGDSIVTDVAYETDTPVDPEDVATAGMDLSHGRRVAYRAGGAGWMKTIIEQWRSSTKCLLAGKQMATIRNL
eukprot:6068562-Pyramimonas_sp.AAC.1